MVRVLFFGVGSGIGGIITALGTDYVSTKTLVLINFCCTAVITAISSLVDKSIEENEYATMKDPQEAALILRHQE